MYDTSHASTLDRPYLAPIAAITAQEIASH